MSQAAVHVPTSVPNSNASPPEAAASGLERANSNLPTSLPPTDQLVQAIAATFPPPAIANTAETPAAETVMAHVQLTFPGHH